LKTTEAATDVLPIPITDREHFSFFALPLSNFLLHSILQNSVCNRSEVNTYRVCLTSQ
jgi:hypothetical protein